ncbi:MAG TPA: 50S ribosomal protein L31 [Holophagaceae bacterium]|jgi:large subunit ribosomal protein L31|nr:50S ribosomal protein L31 [Holophagaceae bacterium]
MKPAIHPELNEVNVHCQCGNEFKTRSVKKELRVEICSNCHPFWTGKHKLLDTAGRVEKFNRKYAKKEEAAVAEAAVETVVPTPEA